MLATKGQAPLSNHNKTTDHNKQNSKFRTTILSLNSFRTFTNFHLIIFAIDKPHDLIFIIFIGMKVKVTQHMDMIVLNVLL